MTENKTKQNDDSVETFVSKVEHEQKRNDCFELIKIMMAVTKEPAKMWGSSIVGFGSYHYKYDSGREGDICMVGFSPRKANIALYIMAGGAEMHAEQLKLLGKHKASAGCLYINKLADIDTKVLKSIIKDSVAYRKKHNT